MNGLPTLEEMNIGRKPKLTDEKRKEIEHQLALLDEEKAKLEKELEG